MAVDKKSKGARKRYVKGTDKRVNRVLAVRSGKKKLEWRDEEGWTWPVNMTELRNA